MGQVSCQWLILLFPVAAAPEEESGWSPTPQTLNIRKKSENNHLIKKQRVCGLFLVALPTVRRSHMHVLIKLMRFCEEKRITVEEPQHRKFPRHCFFQPDLTSVASAQILSSTEGDLKRFWAALFCPQVAQAGHTQQNRRPKQPSTVMSSAIPCCFLRTLQRGILFVFLTWSRAVGATVSAETPSLPWPQSPPPACPGSSSRSPLGGT